MFELRNSFSIAAVNLSGGGGQFFNTCDATLPAVKAAIDNLRAVGIAFIASSGNDAFTTSMGQPACISTAISVGSTTSEAPADLVSSFSNSASFLSLLAPGSAINSSIPPSTFGTLDGTSMAAPHVAGAWALLKHAVPGITVTNALTALQSTGIPVTDLRAGALNRVKPRIRVDLAIASVTTGPQLTCTNPGGLTKTVVNGVADFTGCKVSGAGNNYRIAATAVTVPPVAITAVNSNQFNITGGGGGPTNNIAWGSSLQNGVATLPLGTQPSVQARTGVNVNTSDNTTQVTLSLQPAAGPAEPNGPANEARRPLFGKDSLLPEFADKTPTDEWAVWLAPGSDADTVANSLGAINRGLAAGLPGVYLFKFPGNATFRSAPVVGSLETASAVLQYEQQVILDNKPRTLPNDPGVVLQWHLKNTGLGGRTAGVDINVEPAWDAGFQGQGIKIGIVDDGLQGNHPDISTNYSPAISFDFASNDADPSPAAGNNHGTSVAGLAAARDGNGVCGVGSAYRATLGGIRGGGLPSTDASEASMLGFQKLLIDIYNNSWGPLDIGKLGPIGTLTLASIQGGVTTGRGGLGNIFVWAGGNGRSSNDNVNYDGYASLRQVIAIAALLGDDKFAPYSEPGAPLLVSVPGGTLAGDIFTTDRTGADGYDAAGDCTAGFNGTSAAAPIASGAIALILQANPLLTWRDVQHILVRTAVKNDPTNADWSVNGAGRNTNHNYGFGRLNTAAAVTLAQSWTNIAIETSVTSGVRAVNTAIPDNNATGISRTVTINDSLKLEHVELVFNATHPFRGDLEVKLTSPSGTVSKLAVAHAEDNGDNFTNWKFTSTRYWDELAAGTWTITVDDPQAPDAGTWLNYTLNLFGTVPVAASATLTCTQPLTQTVSAGVANWTGCTISDPGSGYVIRATSNAPQALTPVDSAVFNQTNMAYDATCNGSLDASDSLAVLRQVAGFNSGVLPVLPCTGNVNGNALDVGDALGIRLRIAGLG